MTPAGRRLLTRRLAPLVLAAGLVSLSCSSYVGVSQKTRAYLESRDFARGLAELEGLDGGPDRLLVLLDRALLHHYAAEYDVSNQVFQSAEDLIDDLYTKSVSTEALSLVTSDRIRPYSGAEFERVMIHFYRALNYVALGLREDAVVEARKANHFLVSRSGGHEEVAYAYDGFMEYFTGLLYEWSGAWNDAYISYRNAEAAYRSAEPGGGPGVPRSLARVLVESARRVGLAGEAARWSERYAGLDLQPPGPGEGYVLLIVEVGFAPRLIEARVDLPIFTSDPQSVDAVWALAAEACERRHLHGYEEVELAYLLSIAFPVFRDEPPRTRGLRCIAPGHTARLELGEDIGFTAGRNQQDRERSIILRTAARALIKYLGTKAAEDKGGEVVGFLVNIAGSATEQADVRSWQGLPHDIYVARQVVAAGRHDLVLQAVDARGQEIESIHLSGVDVRPGETTWVTYRIFD